MSEPTPSRVLRGEAVLTDPFVSDLLAARLVGVLSTFDSEGLIHAVPMWYARHDHAVVFATSSHSRKLRNLERDPRATLVVHDSRAGYEVCGVSIAGTVEILRPPAAGALVDVVHWRYLDPKAAGDPEAAAYLASDDVALRLEALAAVTWDERESRAAQVVRARGWALPLVPTEPRP